MHLLSIDPGALQDRGEAVAAANFDLLAFPWARCQRRLSDGRQAGNLAIALGFWIFRRNRLDCRPVRDLEGGVLRGCPEIGPHIDVRCDIRLPVRKGELSSLLPAPDGIFARARRCCRHRRVGLAFDFS